MSDAELRERAHALLPLMGVPDCRGRDRHSYRCDDLLDALKRVRDEAWACGEAGIDDETATERELASMMIERLQAEAAQLRQRVAEIDDENGALKAKLVAERQRVAELERAAAENAGTLPPCQIPQEQNERCAAINWRMEQCQLPRAHLADVGMHRAGNSAWPVARGEAPVPSAGGGRVVGKPESPSVAAPPPRGASQVMPAQPTKRKRRRSGGKR